MINTNDARSIQLLRPTEINGIIYDEDDVLWAEPHDNQWKLFLDEESPLPGLFEENRHFKFGHPEALE